MLQERRNRIIELVRQNRMVKVAALMQEFDVSIETIRRDLEFLEEEGFLKRVYGGAVLEGLYEHEPAYHQREVVNYAGKRAIGAAVAACIQDGDTIFMDVGTTVLEAARSLKDKKNITIITNATQIANAMVDYPGCNVILLGGQLRPGELSVSGYITEQILESFYANKMLMGIGGISLATGVTDYHVDEANVRRKMLAHSREIIALVDSSKFGVTAMNYVCPVECISKLITDATTPSETVEKFRARDINIILAPDI